MYGIAKPWVFSLLIQVLLVLGGVFILPMNQSGPYTLRGFWGLLPLPLLAFIGFTVSLRALGQLKSAPLPRWQKILAYLLNLPGLLFMFLCCLSFFTLILSGMISPSDYANYPSPSGKRSVTIDSRNITCTQHVYLNHGLVMESVGSFRIGTGKCPKDAKAEIWWQPEETAIAWKYGDRQGVIQLPTD